MTEQSREFLAYEYMEKRVLRERMSLYADAYEAFGWIPYETEGKSERSPGHLRDTKHETVELSFRRERKILNKIELTRLQRNFEACVDEIDALEKSKASGAIMASVVVGLIGSAFIAGSVFAIIAAPPVIWLSIALAVLGFIGWIAPISVYRNLVARRSLQLRGLMEQKYDEIHMLCEKGRRLL